MKNRLVLFQIDLNLSFLKLARERLSVKMESSPTMVELPALVVLLISEYLNYNDLRSLRVTCKRLKAIIDLRTFRSLHVFPRGYPFERELLHTGELVSYANICHVSRLDIFKSMKFKSQFEELLKLTIYNEFRYPFSGFKMCAFE